MGRPMPNLRPGWLEDMHAFTVDLAVGQVRSVLSRRTFEHRLLTDAWMVHEFYPQWPEAFLNEVLNEHYRRLNLEAEQAFPL